MGLKPILTFDTSGIGGHDCLANELDLDALVAGITVGFHPRVTFTNLSEIIATTSGERRKEQLAVCKRLMATGDCIDPPHVILEKLVSEFEAISAFDWFRIDVRFPQAEAEIARGIDFAEDLSADERNESRKYDKSFLGLNQQAKPAFDRIFARGDSRVPACMEEFMKMPEVVSLFDRVAKGLYERAAGKLAEQERVTKFLEACPPFRALMLSLFVTLFDRAARPSGSAPTLRVGRNDTFAAIYLPYCDQFVTDDAGQLNCLTEVASICGLRTIIRPYQEFRSVVLMQKTAAASML